MEKDRLAGLLKSAMRFLTPPQAEQQSPYEKVPFTAEDIGLELKAVAIRDHTHTYNYGDTPDSFRIGNTCSGDLLVQSWHGLWTPVKPKPTPTPCEEVGCASFEDLIAIDGFEEGDYFLRERLSEGQSQYLQEHCRTYSSGTFLKVSVGYFFTYEGWFSSVGNVVIVDKGKRERFFNEVFKHKSEVIDDSK